MRRIWLQKPAEAIHRNDHRNILAGVGVAIGGMEWFSLASRYPLVTCLFATPNVLVAGSPEVEPAEPRALIGGQVGVTMVGIAKLHLTGPHAWAAAAAVGLIPADG